MRLRLALFCECSVSVLREGCSPEDEEPRRNPLNLGVAPEKLVQNSNLGLLRCATDYFRTY